MIKSKSQLKRLAIQNPKEAKKQLKLLKKQLAQKELEWELACAVCNKLDSEIQNLEQIVKNNS